MDTHSYRVIRDGSSEEISARGLQILQYFIHHPGKLITLRELKEHIWQAPATESALYQQITYLRKILGDNPRAPKVIKTVPKQGYRFIGDFNRIDSSNKKHLIEQIRHFKTPLSLAAGMLFLLSSVALGYFYEWSFASEPVAIAFNKWSTRLKYPKYTVALQASSQVENTNHPGLLYTMELISEYHLDQNPETNITWIPKLQEKNAISGLSKYFEQHSQLNYVLSPKVVQTDPGELELVLDIQHPAQTQSTPAVNIRVSEQHIATGLQQFEQALLERLRELSLIEAQQLALFTEDSKTNQLILDAAKTLSENHPKPEKIKQAIVSAEHAINRNPRNNISYSLLWEAMSYLMHTDSNYNMYANLETFDFYTSQAIQTNPSYHKNYFAKAAFHCWIQDYEQCANKIGLAIHKNPFDARSLQALSWNLQRNDQSSVHIDKINYEINPLSENVFNFYSNSLINERRFTDVADLIEQHALWDTLPKDWRFEAQRKTDINTLQEFVRWYTQYHPEGWHHEYSHSIATHDNENLPSRYIGFMLLNANQPQLAKYWAQNGAEQHLPYFEFKVVSLLADLWQGNWQPEQWLLESNLAENRRLFQTALDKLYIMYFHYHTGMLHNAENTLLEVFPEFNDLSTFSITRNNFRYAVYYGDILKRQGYFGKSKFINMLAKTHLERLGPNIKRDVDFGIADVEFYALNGDHKQALSTLEQAIQQQGWLPNAFWMWPPIEQNPFLKGIRKKPEFEQLSVAIHNKLKSLCLARSCQTKTDSPASTRH